MNFGSSRNMQRNALRYRKNISEQGALAAADLPGFMDDVYTQQEMDRITASDEFNNEATDVYAKNYVLADEEPERGRSRKGYPQNI